MKYSIVIILLSFFLFFPQCLLFPQGSISKIYSSPSQNNFEYPQSIFVDPQNGHLWVTDFSHHRVLRFDVSSLSAINESESKVILRDFILEQNYPNPFNSSTRITFMARNSGKSELTVFNPLGQKVATLYNGYAAGNKYYTINFNAGDLPSGIYLYSIRSAAGVEVKKMCLLK